MLRRIAANSSDVCLLDIVPMFRQIVLCKQVHTHNNLIDGNCHEEIKSKTLTDNNKHKKEDNASNAIPVTLNANIRRKMVAMLISYCGRGYSGMQRDDSRQTIEGELFRSLIKTGAILQEQYEKPRYCRFQRCSRTDKGVSAAKQIVSLRLGFIDNLKEKLNETLPEQIRVIGYKTVTAGFDAKRNCNARTYSYTLPTFAFAPYEEIIDETYRAPKSVIGSVNEILSQYKGYHNFFNFTAGRLADDVSCKRCILECECSEPFVIEGIEFAVIKFKGESFMLHQIRKMVGLAIALIRGYCPSDTLTKAWSQQRIDIPIAPALGLLLEDVHYDHYNKWYGNDGIHKALVWDEFNEEIKKFKEKFIVSNVVNTEKNKKSMMKWLPTLQYHSFDIRAEVSNLTAVGNVYFALKNLSERC